MSCHAEIDLDAQTGDWDWMTLGVTSLLVVASVRPELWEPGQASMPGRCF